MTEPVYLSDIAAAEAALTTARQNYLRRFGWEETTEALAPVTKWTRDFGALHPEGSVLARHGVVTLVEAEAFELTGRVLDDDAGG